MAKIARQRRRGETQPDKIYMGGMHDIALYNVNLFTGTYFQQRAYTSPAQRRRAIISFSFTFALKPRKTSRAPLTIHAHVGAVPTRTAQKRPTARLTTTTLYAQTTCRAPVLVNSRAHAARR
jgi:hypothetical protein